MPFRGCRHGFRHACSIVAEAESRPNILFCISDDPIVAPTRYRQGQAVPQTGDPRALGEEAPWDYYPYYGKQITPDWKVESRPASKAPSVPVVAVGPVGACDTEAHETPRDAEMDYPTYACQADDLVISRSVYHEKLQGFWLGECIANWTGLRTEGVKKTGPFFTDKGWGTYQGRNNQKIEFVLVEEGDVWGADDDTDIEYIYQSILDENNTSVATPEQIRDGWLRHIKHEEQNYLWVSNETALHLMIDGMLPPAYKPAGTQPALRPD